MNSHQLLLEISDLSVSFDSRKILSAFSAYLRSGEKIAITGESGTGKSTLLKCILGFIRPDSGIIRIAGKELSSKNIWDLRREIGYIPQEPDLGKGAVEPGLLRPFQYKANKNLMPDRDRIQSLFSRFRLEPELLKKDIANLSGGEKQRIAIITALLLKRKIYLLDEATSALDDITREAVVDYFTERRELTILTVTHDRRFLSICNRSYKLNKSEGSKE